MTAFLMACFLNRITAFVKTNKAAPKAPAIPGETIHARNTCETPFIPQFMLLMPTEAVAAPTRPPRVECVVDTGKPYRVAKVRKMEEPTRVHIMARSRTLGWSLKCIGSTILVRIVSATREPTAIEPETSVKHAMAIACFIVRDRDEMDVANELATSLAPGMR